MSERRDDTTEQGESSSGNGEPRPGSYYYDDATGYELYDPAEDEDETESNEATDDAREALNDE
jgi:hypothetical protein